MSLFIEQIYDDVGKRVPDSCLLKRAEPVDISDAGLRVVHASVRDAVEAMHRMRGVGIAWPQIGISLRVFVSCPGGLRGNERVFVNPDVFTPSGGTRTVHSSEGCLSVCRGTKHLVVHRFPEVVIHAHEILDWHKPVSSKPGRGARFMPVHYTAKGMEALVLQHEHDHLDGILLGGNLGKV